jgi:hypothetical protein
MLAFLFGLTDAAFPDATSLAAYPRPRIQPGTGVLAMMTPWHEGRFYVRRFAALSAKLTALSSSRQGSVFPGHLSRHWRA